MSYRKRHMIHLEPWTKSVVSLGTMHSFTWNHPYNTVVKFFLPTMLYVGSVPVNEHRLVRIGQNLSEFQTPQAMDEIHWIELSSWHSTQLPPRDVEVITKQDWLEILQIYLINRIFTDSGSNEMTYMYINSNVNTMVYCHFTDYVFMK